MAWRSSASAIAWRTSGFDVGSWSPARSRTTHRVDGAWIASSVVTPFADLEGERRRELGELHLARPEARHDRGLVRDRLVDDPVEQRLLRPPVGRVALEGPAPARIELLDHEGAGADGLRQEGLAVARRVLRDDAVVLPADVDEKRCRRPAQHEADGVLVDRVDLLHEDEVVGPRAHLRVADPVVRVLHVLGVHLLAVVEAHAAPQVEHELGGRPLLPALGQLGLRLEAVVDPDEVLVDERLPALEDVEPLHVGLDVRRQRRARDGEHTAGLRLGARPPWDQAGHPERRRPAADEEGATGEGFLREDVVGHDRSPSRVRGRARPGRRRPQSSPDGGGGVKAATAARTSRGRATPRTPRAR